MTTNNHPRSTIQADRLRSFGREVLLALGVPADDALLVADSLVQADLWGHQSHGMMRLPWYVARLRSGVMKYITAPDMVVDTGALVVLDGHDGIGQVIATQAAQISIQRAKRHGVGVVAVRNSNHFGTAMYYTKMAVEAGCVAFLSTNASPAMAPWGGREKRVGTNPWSIAAPTGSDAPMILDIANTAVARGKIYLARQNKTVIPEGWALDGSGKPTTDPVQALAGMVLPMAGHKGYAIALMMDVLSGVLTGSGFGTTVQGPYQAEKQSGCGHLMIALNIEAFMPPDEFNARMAQLIAEIKGVPCAEGSQGVFYPGEIEARNAQSHLKTGLLLPEDTITALRELAAETGVAVDF